jgi:hypothetical protein
MERIRMSKSDTTKFDSQELTEIIRDMGFRSKIREYEKKYSTEETKPNKSQGMKQFIEPE